MPRTASVRKALRTARKRRAHNLITLVTLRGALKKTSLRTINTAYKMIDKATKARVVSATRAARLKSRLIKKIGATPPGEAKKVTSRVSTASRKSPSAKKKPARARSKH